MEDKQEDWLAVGRKWQRGGERTDKDKKNGTGERERERERRGLGTTIGRLRSQVKRGVFFSGVPVTRSTSYLSLSAARNLWMVDW